MGRLVDLGRRLVPSGWREAIGEDLEDEAVAAGYGDVWLATHLAVVGLKMRVALTFDAVSSDFKYAVRSLRAARWFTLGAVLTFMLGIGVNIAVFSAVDRLLFRTLPYNHPESLVLMRVCERSNGSCRQGSFPAAINARLLSESATIEDLGVAGFSAGFSSDAAETGDQRFRLMSVSAHALRVLGVQPSRGRDISEEEIRTKVPVAWLSDEAWKARLGSDPDVLGRTLRSGNRRATVVGILPPGFIPPAWSAHDPAWAGLIVDHVDPWVGFSDRPASLVPFARLKPGITPAQAQAEIAGIVDAQNLLPPRPGVPPLFVRVDPVDSAVFSNVRPYAWLVVTAAWLVLLMACTNLTSLFLARGRSREHFAAMASALGASPSRLVMASISESLVVCIVGAALAIAALAVTREVMVQLLPPLFGRYVIEFSDFRVLELSVLVTALTAVIAGTVPGVKLSRIDVLPVLQRGTRSGQRVRILSGRWLLGGEAAIGALLVLGAVLAGRSFNLLTRDTLGFKPEGLYSVTLGGGGRVAMEQQGVRMTGVLEAAAAIPGVEGAATADWIPFSADAPARGTSSTRNKFVALVQVSTGFFQTMRTPLLAGRLFEAADVGESHVAIVNRSAVRRLFPDATADQVVGRHWVSEDGLPFAITGVIEDLKTSYGQQDPTPAVFIPGSRYPSPWDELLVRPAAGKRLSPTELQAALKPSAGNVTVEVRPTPDLIDPALRDPRFRAALLAVLALTGLLLAAVGLFAVASYDATVRYYEMGVRLALGATPGQLKWLVLRQACVPVVAGTIAGLIGAWWLSGLVQTFLFRTDSQEPAYYAIVSVVLVTTGVLAAWVPANRASRVDPVALLKTQ